MAITTDYALMAGASYISTRNPINQFPVPEGWKRIDTVADPVSGFEAATFSKGTEIVISYAGTYDQDLLGDKVADAVLGLGDMSDQLRLAAGYYIKTAILNPDAHISFTGHSLGGGLASLIAVFFNKVALTFDQAPFFAVVKLTTFDDIIIDRGYNNAQDLLAYLQNEYSSSPSLPNLLEPLISYSADLLADRAINVADISVRGELLSSEPPFSYLSRVGIPSHFLEHAASNFTADLLHSQALLTAFSQSGGLESDPLPNTFRAVTYKLSDLIPMIFRNGLYTNSTDQPYKNFIEHLVRHEFGNAPGVASADLMLTRFTDDLWRIAQDGGLTVFENFTTTDQNGNTIPHALVGDTLIAFAMQKYYYETNWNASPVLFSDVSGGIRLDLNDVASTLNDAKGYNIYFKDYIANIFTSNEQASINSILPNLRDWYVQAGLNALNVTDTLNHGAFMLGGAGQDNLIGGNQADLLIGNDGSDTLTGGGGTDTLIGDTGNDTYYINAGDTIIDKDGLGTLIFDGDTLSGGTRKAGETNYHSADGKYTYQWSGGDLIINQTVTIKNFKNDNDLGIHLSGGGGVIITDIDSNYDEGRSVTVQANGKILVAGLSYLNDDDFGAFTLVRYSSNGSLDTSFDGDGKVSTNFSPWPDYGISVTVQADGKILVAGVEGISRGFALARYNVDGSLDSSFDGDGKVTTEFANQYATSDGAQSIVLQPDGKILVAGSVPKSDPVINGQAIQHYDFGLLRYNVDGSLDSSFNSDGIVTTNILYTLPNGSKWSGNEFAQSITLQPDGKILVAGFLYGGDSDDFINSYDFGLMRYNNDGSLDTSFSGDGIVRTPISPASSNLDPDRTTTSARDLAQSVTLQADGKILVAGSSNNGYREVIALVRYNTDGSLDTSFGGDGKVTTDIPDSVYGAGASSVIIQTDGKILVAGGSDNGGDGTFALVRYNTDGSLDTSFDGDGIVTAALMGSGKSVSLQPDGKILVVGDSDLTGRNVDFALVRFNTDGSLDSSFDGIDGTSLAITSSNINENIIANSIVGKLTGTAADGRNISTYSLSAGGDNKAFTIIGDQLQINSSPNFESKSNYNLTVRMTDQGGLSFDKALTIGINNVNETPTKLAMSASSINEAVAANSAVGALSSTDPDANNTFSYSLVTGTGSADNSAFTISGNQLFINTAPNFTLKPSYNILVRTTDQGGLFFDKAMTINVIANPNAIRGTDGIDNLIGDAGNNTLYGLGGNDSLNGGVGADTLVGGLGDDSYVVDNAVDIVTENLNEGTDKISSRVTYTLPTNVENLTLTGALAINGTGTDLANSIIGNTAINILTGGAGNDTLNGAGGADTMIGGLGNDTFVVNDVGDVSTEFLNEGTDKVNSNITFTLPIHVENLTLTGALVVDGTGNDLDNVIIGNGAANQLHGQAGNDTLNGGGGDDTLTGWSGVDTMIGGLGNDTYFVENTGDIVTENLNAGTDTVSTRLTYTLPNNVENLILTGTTAVNGTGNALANIITGNNAVNQLNGLAGNDTLNGGAGNDILDGGTGTNTLTGGTGNDVFKLTTAGHIDTIADYNVTNDTIQLENAVFTALTTAGVVAAGQFRVGTQALDNNDFVIYNNVTGALLYDANGNGAGATVQIATLSAGLAMTNLDFVVI